MMIKKNRSPIFSQTRRKVAKAAKGIGEAVKLKMDEIKFTATTLNFILEILESHAKNMINRAYIRNHPITLFFIHRVSIPAVM